MVRWKGFEPLTFWFVVRHSIQLSYQRISFATVLCGARNILSDSFSIVNAFFEIFWIFLRGLNLGPFALPFPLCFRINGLLISDQESGPGQNCFGSFYGSGRAEKERNVGFHPFFTFLPVPRGRNCRQQANTSLFVQNKKICTSHEYKFCSYATIIKTKRYVVAGKMALEWEKKAWFSKKYSENLKKSVDKFSGIK